MSDIKLSWFGPEGNEFFLLWNEKKKWIEFYKDGGLLMCMPVERAELLIKNIQEVIKLVRPKV